MKKKKFSLAPYHIGWLSYFDLNRFFPQSYSTFHSNLLRSTLVYSLQFPSILPFRSSHRLNRLHYSIRLSTCQMSILSLYSTLSTLFSKWFLSLFRVSQLNLLPNVQNVHLLLQRESYKNVSGVESRSSRYRLVARLPTLIFSASTINPIKTCSILEKRN